MAVIPMLNCRFFKSEQGNEPVREWLKGLPAEAKKEIGSDIQRVQWQWPVSKPLVDGLGGGLYEVRTKLESSTASSSVSPTAAWCCCTGS